MSEFGTLSPIRHLERFSQAVVERVMQAGGLTLKELATSLDLSPRSLQRRRREGRLARYESDRLYRLARINALAKQSLAMTKKQPDGFAAESRSGRQCAAWIDRYRTRCTNGGECSRTYRLRRLGLSQVRILRKAYAKNALHGGEGAYRFGGRWSTVGTRLAYAAEHASLAMIEYARAQSRHFSSFFRLQFRRNQTGCSTLRIRSARLSAWDQWTLSSTIRGSSSSRRQPCRSRE